MGSEGTRTGARVLLVESDESAGGKLARTLEASGLSVRLVTEPFEAIRESQEQGVDLVTVRVPLEGFDAVAACAALKDDPAPPCVVLLDGAGQAQQIEAALPVPLRPDAILPYPSDARKLLAEIRGLLGHGAPQERAARPSARRPSFAQRLVELYEAQETGVLEIRAEEIRTNITFERGEPVFVEGGGLRKTLGRLLLSRGEIREEDYVRVIERMTERTIRNESVRMGEVLVELGILSPAEVFEALTLQVREKIVACFQWEELESVFRPLEELPEEMAPFRCGAVEALVMEGMRSYFDSERLRPLLRPHASRFPVLVGELREIASRFQMNPVEQKFLFAITGEKSLAALRSETSLDPLHASRILAALLLTHKLDLRDEPSRGTQPRESAPPQPRPTATREAAPAADPAPPAGSPAPRRTARTADRARRTLDALRKQVKPAAGKGAAPAVATPPPDQRQARLEAERAFRKGQQMLHQNLLQGAANEFRKAAELDPEQIEYHMFEAWAAYLGARGEETRTLAKAKTRALARKLLQQDQDASNAHSILGRFLHEEGEVEAAERHFRLALRKNEHDRQAQRGLRLIESRRRR